MSESETALLKMQREIFARMTPSRRLEIAANLHATARALKASWLRTQHRGFRADCYLPGKSEIARWELTYRRRLETLFGDCWFSPPESVVLHKLLFYREGKSDKHLEDIRAMLASGSIQDLNLLTDWISAQHLENEWKLACDER